MMWIKDLTTGKVRKYGTDPHDALRISDDGRYLTYENMQNGDGSGHGEYRFVTERGYIPQDDGAYSEGTGDDYFNIGGWFGDIDFTIVSRPLTQDGRRSVGWLYRFSDKDYGDYIILADGDNREDIKKAVSILLDQMWETVDTINNRHGDKK